MIKINREELCWWLVILAGTAVIAWFLANGADFLVVR